MCWQNDIVKFIRSSWEQGVNDHNSGGTGRPTEGGRSSPHKLRINQGKL